MQHEKVVEEDGIIDIKSDPQPIVLIKLELENKIYCTSLNEKVRDVNQLRLASPRVFSEMTKTVINPQTAKYLETIAKTKGAGQLFHVT